jgi:hypothetical protein
MLLSTARATATEPATPVTPERFALLPAAAPPIPPAAPAIRTPEAPKAASSQARTKPERVTSKQTTSSAATAPSKAQGSGPIERASAIYITGSARLQPGRRYLIVLLDERFQVLGPVDDDPSKVALDLAVSGMEATAINGRLVVNEFATGRATALAFMAVGGSTPERLAAAITAAAGDATSPR